MPCGHLFHLASCLQKFFQIRVIPRGHYIGERFFANAASLPWVMLGKEQ